MILAVITALATLFAACVSDDPAIEKIEFLSEVKDFSVYVTQEVTVPDVEYTSGATLAVAVTDPSGSAIAVNENRFTPASVGEYRIVYTITLDELSDEKVVKVTVVSNDVLPVLTVGKNEERVLLGTVVTLASATATDALGSSIEVNVEVKDPEGNAVALADGKFTPALKGVYTVVYTATDIMGKKASETHSITVYKNPDPVCDVPEEVKNSFETEAECFIDKLNSENSRCAFSRNDTETFADGVHSGAYSLKAEVSEEGTVNFMPQSIAGAEDFSEIGTLSFWVYNADEKELGMSIYKIICKDNTVAMAECYKLVPAKSWRKFSVNLTETGIALGSLEKLYCVQFWFARSVTVYFDDIVYDDRADYATIGEVTKSIDAKPGDVIALENPEVSDGATLTVEVTDPKGALVTVSDGKFTVEDEGEYKIVYTADNGKHSASATTVVTVTPDVPESKGDVPADVNNSFETEEECALSALNAENGSCEFTRNDTSKNYDGVRSGSYSLKANLKSGSNINFIPEAITGGKDFSNIGTLSFWVYNPNDKALGMSIFKLICSDNTVYQPETYKAIPAKSWWQFTVNVGESGVAASSLSKIWAVQFWVERASEIYFDDIIYTPKSSEPVSKGDVPADVNNSFETEEACALSALNAENGSCEFTRNNTLKNADGVRSGAYSLKANLTSGDKINFVPEAITGGKDFSNIGTLSFWVYNPNDEALGMSIFKVICSDNSVAQPNAYKSIPAKSWCQFTVNVGESGVAASSLSKIWAVQFWVERASEIYFDDISYTAKA